MRFSPATIALVVAIFAQAAKQPDDGIAWGPPDHGLRLGIAFGPSAPDPQLRIVFQNIDRPECLVPLGSTSGKGDVYDIEFKITSPAGKEFPLFNFNGPAGIQPAAKPIVIEIPKHQSREVLLDHDWLRS